MHCVGLLKSDVHSATDGLLFDCHNRDITILSVAEMDIEERFGILQG